MKNNTKTICIVTDKGTVSNARSIQVGQRISYTVGSDRYPAEIVYVSKSGHRIVVRDAKVTKYDEHGFAVAIETDADGSEHTYTRRNTGTRSIYQRAGWNHSGLDLDRGWRGFLDPSF